MISKTEAEFRMRDYATNGDAESALYKPGSQLDTDSEETIEPRIHLKTFLVVLAVNFIYFAQIVNVVGVGAFARDISTVVGGANNLIWLSSSITILTVILGPPVTQATDYWGRKWFLVILTACGFVGSLVVAQATSMTMAIVGQAITGMSHGAQPLVHAVTSEVMPRKWRPYAQGSNNVAVAGGAILGLLVGGALTRNGHAEGFRTFWYITSAIFGSAAIVCAILYNPPPRELQISLTLKEKLGRLDWVGYFLLTVGLILLCAGLSLYSNPYPWTEPCVWATFSAGVVVSIALIAYERFAREDGLFHHGLFRCGRNFGIAIACIFIEGMIFFAANNFFAFEASILYDTDGFITTLRYTITFFAFGLAAILTGAYCSRVKMVKWPTVIAFVLFIIFNALMASATLESSKALWGYPILLGMGLGTCLCCLLTIAQLSTPPELIAVASGLMISVRSLGGSIGLAVYDAIFNAHLNSQLGPNIANATLPLGLPETSLGPLITALTLDDTAAVRAVKGITPSIVEAAVHALKLSFLDAFRYVWVTAASIAVIAAIAAAFLVEKKDAYTSTIDAPAEAQDGPKTPRISSRMFSASHA